MREALKFDIGETGPSPAVELCPGFPSAIDQACRDAAPSHAFLRRAWFAAGGSAGASTLIGRRDDGSLLAAIPLAPMGPAMLGMRMVPGSYWPFRSPVIAEDAREDELHALLSDSIARIGLGQVWRLGPVYADDPAVRRLAKAARAAGWTMLKREMGTTYVMDIPALTAAGQWPRRSTLRKVRAYERQLAEQGPLDFRFVRGEGWDAATLDALATIEANSWVGTRTDGTGAKFLKPEQRAYWESALRDPKIAAMLSSAILFVGDTPAAFSFDLNVGRLQYGIAGGYDDRFARWSAGKVVTWRHLDESMARGIEIVDWGSGDSGYKRGFGAQAGPEIVDHLFVRSRAVAAVLRPRWTKGAEDKGGGDEAAPLLSRREQLLVAAIVTAAAAVSLSE